MSLYNKISKFGKSLVWLGAGVLAGCSAFGSMTPKPLLNQDERVALEQRVADAQSQTQEPQTEASESMPDVPEKRVFPLDPFFYSLDDVCSQIQEIMAAHKDNPDEGSLAVLEQIKDKNSDIGKACLRVSDLVSLYTGERFSIDDYGVSDALSFFDAGILGKGKRVHMLSKLNSMVESCSPDDALHLLGYEFDFNTDSDSYSKRPLHKLRTETVADLFKWFVFDGIRKQHNLDYGMMQIERKVVECMASYRNYLTDFFVDFESSSKVLAAYLVAKHGPERAWRLARYSKEADFVSLFPKDKFFSLVDFVDGDITDNSLAANLKARFSDGVADLDSALSEKHMVVLNELEPIFDKFRNGDFSDAFFNSHNLYFNTDGCKFVYFKTGHRVTIKASEHAFLSPGLHKYDPGFNDVFLDKQMAYDFRNGAFGERPSFMGVDIGDSVGNRLNDLVKGVDWSVVEEYAVNQNRDYFKIVLSKLADKSISLKFPENIDLSELTGDDVSFMSSGDKGNESSVMLLSHSKPGFEYCLFVDAKGPYVYTLGKRFDVPDFVDLAKKAGLVDEVSKYWGKEE